MTAEPERRWPDFVPHWPTCDRGDERLCPGVRIRGFDGCLWHLTDDERIQFLSTLHPGADLDVRGTHIPRLHLEWLLPKFRDPMSGAPTLGNAQFQHARFFNDVSFDGVRFDGNISFSYARFERNVSFSCARIRKEADFRHAQFEQAALLGPMLAEKVRWDHAQFARPVELRIAANSMSCNGTRFEHGTVLLLRGTELDLSEAKFGAPSSIVGSEFLLLGVSSKMVDGERTLTPDPVKRSLPALTSLRGVDVSELSLTNVDLRWCHFGGAYNLDQIRIGGRCSFNNPPSSRRWAQRQVLVEECHWRNSRHRHAGWDALALHLPKPTDRTDPEELTVLYRSLRKAFEDSKNEAGAGDFYYGEMEARRHASTTTRPERWILTTYWLISGYGQRAWRALTAIAVLVTVVTGILIGWGLPQPAQQQVTGAIQPGQATLVVSEPPPVLPPASQRWTLARSERAMQISIGAIVFRDVEQKLTSTGTWTVTVARIAGPLLLALAVLAIRARVKR